MMFMAEDGEFPEFEDCSRGQRVSAVESLYNMFVGKHEDLAT